MELSGKVILITGAASGIGFETAKEFLKHGIKGIVIVDLNSSTGEESVKTLKKVNSEVDVIFIKTDVGDEDQVKHAYQQANAKFPQIDIVVNAAGIYNDKKWQQEIHVNLVGVINSTLQAIECMRTDKGGRGGVIINISSLVGIRPSSISPIYSATKFAVQGLSRSFGVKTYAAKTGVNVVTVCPGVTGSDMYYNDISTAVLDDSITSQLELREALNTLQFQTPEDAAKGIVKAAIDGEPGAVWLVDGGRARKIELSISEK